MLNPLGHLGQFALRTLFDLAVRTFAFADHIRIYCRGVILGLAGNSSHRRKHAAVSSSPDPPSILALIVAQEALSAQEVNQVLRCLPWCRNLGHVRHLILYDPSGTLKECLGRAAERSNAQFPELEIHVISAEDAVRPLIDASRGPHIPTVGEARQKKQDLDSIADTRVASGAACSTATTMAAGAPTADVFSCAIDPAVLDGELKRSGPAWATLRPELALVFGPVLTLAGFPPWNSTRMEILHLGRLGKLSEKGLRGAIDRFMRTQQRFGR